MKDTDKFYMNLAIRQARAAFSQGEIPVGAVIVCADKIVGQGRNMREGKNNALAHAEIAAINEACLEIGSWRLCDCTIYITMEPCPMCAGAIINARIKRVVFGAPDPKTGCFGSVVDMSKMGLGYCPRLSKGVLEEQCSGLLKEFFASLRTES